MNHSTKMKRRGETKCHQNHDTQNWNRLNQAVAVVVVFVVFNDAV